MWIEGHVIIATPGLNAFDRRILDSAMERRGWAKAGTDGYSASFLKPESDKTVVKNIEQDVKQATYVAGIKEFDAFCYLKDGLTGASSDSSFKLQDSDINFG